MAIQVNGTTVIDNSRALTNIASVDAATKSAFDAAGIGGTNVTFTAAENINKSQPIAVADNGTAALVQLTTCNTRPVITFDGFQSYTSNTGQVKYIPHIGSSTQSIYAILGHNNYYNYIAFLILNEDGTYTYKSPVYIGGYSGGNYERQYDIASDGQGNWAVCYAHYHGYASSHFKNLVTFSTDSSFNISNMSSPVQVGGDNYRWNWRIASYDTNKFCLFYREDQNTVGYLNYYTFYRNGSSLSQYSSGNFGSTNAAAAVFNAVGHSDPYVPTNKIALAGGADQYNPTFGRSGSNYNNWAATVIFSNNVPSVGTVYKTATNGLQYDYSNDSTNYNNAEMPNGYLFQAVGNNGAGTLWQKASPTSDVYTEVISFEGDSGNSFPMSNYVQYGATLYAPGATGTLDSYDCITAQLLKDNEPIYGTYPNQNVASYNYGSRGHVKNNKLYMIQWSGNTSQAIYITTLGNVTGMYGVAGSSATTGNQVKLTVQGQTVDGFSNLTVGKVVGFNNAGNSIVVGGSPRVGVAIASDTVLIDTIG